MANNYKALMDLIGEYEAPKEITTTTTDDTNYPFERKTDKAGINIHDADTVYKDGQGYRLGGIDAPEMPSTQVKLDRLQKAKESKLGRHVSVATPGEIATMEAYIGTLDKDTSITKGLGDTAISFADTEEAPTAVDYGSENLEGEKGKYGRTLVDNEAYKNKMLSEGYVTPYYDASEEDIALTKEAKEQGKGLWSSEETAKEMVAKLDERDVDLYPELKDSNWIDAVQAYAVRGFAPAIGYIEALKEGDISTENVGKKTREVQKNADLTVGYNPEDMGIFEKMRRAAASGTETLANKVVGLAGEGVETLGEGLQGIKNLDKEFVAKENERLAKYGEKVSDTRAGLLDTLQVGEAGEWLANVGKGIQKDTVEFIKSGEADKLVGYDTTDEQELAKQVEKDIEGKGYINAFANAITDARSLQVLAKSVPEMMALAASVGTMAIVNANNNINVGEDKLGREMNANEKALSISTSIVATYIDRLGDKLALSGINPAKEALKEVVEKAPKAVQNTLASTYGKAILKIGEAPLRLAGAAGIEGVTEAVQTTGETLAQEPTKFTEGLTEEDITEAKVAGVLGAAAGGQMATPRVGVDIGKDAVQAAKGAKKPKEEMPKEVEEAIEAEVGTSGDIEAELQTAIDANDIVSIKDTISKGLDYADETGDKALEAKILTIYRDNKEKIVQLSKAFEEGNTNDIKTMAASMDDQKKAELGEAIVEELGTTEASTEVVAKIQDALGVTEEAAQRIVNDAVETNNIVRKAQSVVEDEVVTGPRGYKTYISAYRRAARSGDEKAADMYRNKLLTFASKQREKAKLYEAAINEAKSAINSDIDGMTEVEKTATLEQLSNTDTRKVKVEGHNFEINYKNVARNMLDGTARGGIEVTNKINESAQAMEDFLGMDQREAQAAERKAKGAEKAKEVESLSAEDRVKVYSNAIAKGRDRYEEAVQKELDGVATDADIARIARYKQFQDNLKQAEEELATEDTVNVEEVKDIVKNRTEEYTPEQEQKIQNAIDEGVMPQVNKELAEEVAMVDKIKKLIDKNRAGLDKAEMQAKVGALVLKMPSIREEVNSYVDEVYATNRYESVLENEKLGEFEARKESMDLRELSAESAKLVDTMKNAVRAKLDEIVDYSKAQYTEEDPSMKFVVDGKHQEELVEAMAVEIAKYIENLNTLTYNDDQQIKKMLGFNDTSWLTKEARDTLKGAGRYHGNEAAGIGAGILKNMGIKQKGSADYRTQARMEASVGALALAVMEARGWISYDNSMDASMLAGIKEKVAAYNSNNGVSIEEEGDSVVDSTGKKVQFVKANKEAAKKVMDAYKDRVAKLNEEMEAEGYVKGPQFRKVAEREYGARNAEEIEVPKHQQDAMKKLESTKWKVNQGRVQVLKELVGELPREVEELTDADKKVLEVFGYKDASEAHVDQRDGIEAKNRVVLDSIHKIIDFAEKAENKPFWFKWFFSKSGRYFMDTVEVNPQTDKLHRFMLDIDGAEVEVDTEAKRNEFKLAVVQAFDGSKVDDEVGARDLGAIDKQTLEESLVDFELLKRKIEGSDNTLELIKGTDHPAHALMAIEEMKKYREDDSFKTGMTIETDAVTSGFILGLMTNPVMDMEDSSGKHGLKTWLSKGGVWLGGTELKGFGEWKKTDVDAYETSAVAVKREVELLSTDKKTKAVVELVGDVNRKFMKSPFMTFIYGSSIENIKKHVAYEQSVKMIEKLMDTKTTADTIRLLNEAGLGKEVRKTFGNRTAEEVAAAVKDMSAERELRELVNAYKNAVEKVHGEAIGRFMENEFGAIVEQGTGLKSLVNKSFVVMFEGFKKELDKKLKNDTTKDGLDKAIAELVDEGKVPGIFTVEADRENAKEKTPIYKRAKVKNLGKGMQVKLKSGQRTVHPMIREMVAAPASGAVLNIHWLDGSILGNVISDKMLPIHDAVLQVAGNAVENSKKYSEATWDMTQRYSVVDEAIAELSKMDLDEAGKKTLSGLKELKVKIDANKAEFARMGADVEHMAMPGSKTRVGVDAVVKEADTATEAMQETVQEGPTKVMIKVGNEKYEVEFVDASDKRLNGALARGLVVKKGITKQEVIEHVTGGTGSDVSVQKDLVTKVMKEDGIDLVKELGDMTDSDVKRFVIYHEISHLKNEDKKVYWKDGKQELAAKYGMVQEGNKYLSDSAVKIEARANKDALRNLGKLKVDKAPWEEDLGETKLEDVSIQQQKDIEKKAMSMIPDEDC